MPAAEPVKVSEPPAPGCEEPIICQRSTNGERLASADGMKFQTIGSKRGDQFAAGAAAAWAGGGAKS